MASNQAHTGATAAPRRLLYRSPTASPFDREVPSPIMPGPVRTRLIAVDNRRTEMNHLRRGAKASSCALNAVWSCTGMTRGFVN